MAKKDAPPAPGHPPVPLWKDDPDAHDYPAAANYLSLIADAPLVKQIVHDLQKAPITHYKAKDLLRSSRLHLLPMDDRNVARDLAKVVRGEKLSPILLVRGHIRHDVPMTVADGYHRICASYHLGDDTDIPCRIVDLPEHG